MASLIGDMSQYSCEISHTHLKLKFTGKYNDLLNAGRWNACPKIVRATQLRSCFGQLFS